jgi:hypothetical protein
MRRTCYQTLGITILLLGLAVQAHGQIYTERMTTGMGNDQQHSQTYYMPKMMKIVHHNGNALIIRLDKELLISVDNQKKEYSQMTFAELETRMKEMRGRMEAALQEMQKKMADMPPEQRKLMEQMMAKSPVAGLRGGQYEVKRSGETKTISGFACTKYVVTRDGSDVLVLWTTKDVKEFATLRQDYEQFVRRMAPLPASASKGSGGMPTDAWTEAMKVIDGFPIQEEVMGVTTVVTKLVRKPIATSEFEPPAGYKQVAPAALQR